MATSDARVLYLDASAILKLLVREAETDQLAAFIAGAALVSSEIAGVEVPRATYLQTGDAQSIVQAEILLGRFTLVPLDDELRREAARARPPELRALDAIHLASCTRVAARLEAVVVYDRRLAAALLAREFRVEAPAGS